MHILLSNDDGYQAPGLRTLAAHVAELARVTVVAPERDRSGASNSLTLDYPLRATRMEDGYIRVDGTPTDCVHLAVTGMLEEEPDMVISGINAGANMGDDVLYSGTVAAAMEGRFLGLPAIAVSLVLAPRPAADVEGGNPAVAGNHYATAARVVLALIQRLLDNPLPPDTILNVNVPDLPWEALQGFAATRLGHRHKSESVVPGTDPRGCPLYWIGPVGAEQEAGPGTDFHAVRHNRVSITPIQVDLTRHNAIAEVHGWLQGLQG